MKPVTLGAWRLSSGNGCDLLYHGADAPRPVVVAWDHWPLSAAETAEYLARVQPGILRTILDYTERRHQRTLVLTLL